MAPAMETSNNPYAPPKALALEVPPEAPPEKNKHVEWACKLMWFGMGLSVLASLLVVFTTGGDSPERMLEIIGEVVGLAIGFLIVWWFTNKLRAGRNWMRMLITILTVVGLVVFAIVAVVMLSIEDGADYAGTMFEMAPMETISMFGQTALSVAEVVLINTSSSRAWFQAKKYAD